MAGSQEEPPPADAEMAEAGSSDSSDSDSDSEFEEVDISPEDTKLLMRLEQSLQDNPNLYDSHVQARGAAGERASRRHICCIAALVSCHPGAFFVVTNQRSFSLQLGIG